MQIRYYKEYSRYLDRFMEFKVYGHAGRPIIIFPCQSGRFYDWEDRNMCNLAAPWIDSGKLQIFTADSIDPESWDNHGPERPRIEMQERWYNYICEELTPRLLEINREQGGEDHTGKILVGGASIGGGHAVNFFLRRPDLYNGTIALSGLYSSRMFFGDYMDDLVYRNSPCDYMRNFPTVHPYMELFNKADKFIMCCGQGAWEGDLLASTLELQGILESKGIHPIVDIWGYDVAHDWVWWEKQWNLLPADDAGQPVTGCTCMDFWHDSAVQKRWLLRLALFIGLLLIPIFVLAVFARPSADDYIYAARTHAVMQQYGFDLPRLLKAAWDTNVYYFENWQGLYVSGFLLAWQPAIFGNAWYGVTLLCVLVPLFFCLYGACRCVVRRLTRRKSCCPGRWRCWSALPLSRACLPRWKGYTGSTAQ